MLVSFERTDIKQFSNILFYYNRLSISTNDSSKSMGRFGIELFLADNTWSTRCNIPKNDRHSDTSTDWTKLSLFLSVQNYGFKLIYNQIDTPHGDICFSNITIPHPVF